MLTEHPLLDDSGDKEGRTDPKPDGKNGRVAAILSLGTPAAAAEQSYPALPSLPTATDPYNTAIIGGFGINALTTTFPALSESQLSEPLGLTYTTAPLAKPVISVGRRL